MVLSTAVVNVTTGVVLATGSVDGLLKLWNLNNSTLLKVHRCQATRGGISYFCVFGVFGVF